MVLNNFTICNKKNERNYREVSKIMTSIRYNKFRHAHLYLLPHTFAGCTLYILTLIIFKVEEVKALARPCIEYIQE